MEAHAFTLSQTRKYSPAEASYGVLTRKRDVGSGETQGRWSWVCCLGSRRWRCRGNG